MPAPETLLILVRHSQPEIDPRLPAAQWPLSAAGRERCQPLARALSAYPLHAVISSHEPKAIQTARLVAAALNLPASQAPGLHEHERPAAGLTNQEEFQAAVACLFAHPGQLVMGAETADQARQRFTQAVHALLAAHPGQNLAVVAHGTVISLFVAHACRLDPFPLWQSLTLPCFIPLTQPSLTLLSPPHLIP
ncbi:MAG: histidine phosphatase family protein [Chloroflexota bacterium]